jgi:hypothetical protein
MSTSLALPRTRAGSTVVHIQSSKGRKDRDVMEVSDFAVALRIECVSDESPDECPQPKPLL